MASTQYGQKLSEGAACTINLPGVADYYLESVTENEAEIDEEFVNDADGKIVNNSVYGNYPVITATLVCKTAAVPATNYPVGTSVQIGSDYWWIESAPVTKTKSPHRMTVKLVKYNLAAV